MTSCDRAFLETDKQLLDLQVLRADAVHRRNRAVQHVVAAVVLPGPLQHEYVFRLFHDAK